MSKIKSALELALERTADVKVDKDALKRDTRNKEGRQLAGRYLSEPQKTDIKASLEGIPKDEREWAKNGLVDALLANIALPRFQNDVDRLPIITAGLVAVAKDPGTVEYVMTQYTEMFGQYLENVQQVEDQLRAQWESRLRQKEAQLRQQTGQSVTLTPEQDPEFGKYLSDQLSQLDAQYAEILSRGKEEIKRLA